MIRHINLSATTIEGALAVVRNAVTTGRPFRGSHVSCYAAVGMAIHAREKADDQVLLFGLGYGPTHSILVDRRNMTVRDTGDGDYDGVATYWHKTKLGRERDPDDCVKLLLRVSVRQLFVITETAAKAKKGDGPTAKDLIDIANDKSKSDFIRRHAELHLDAIRSVEPNALKDARDFVQQVKGTGS